ncbi:MAG: hypothetical protein ACFFBP_00380 [Promethearchaeota archaeon]
MSNPNNNQEVKFCSFCGSEIRINAQFCFACGQRFDVATPSEPIPSPHYMSKREEIALKIAEKKEIIAAKVAQKKKEIAAKKVLKREAIQKKKQEIKAKKKAKKTYRKGLIVGFVLSCLIFAIVGFFMVGFITQGTYEESFTYYYSPASPSPIEEILVYGDTAEINIQYNATPVEYYAKVDVDLYVSGLFVSGKKYENFFNPMSWENSSSASFSLTSIAWSWVDPTNWIKMMNNVITVTLRTDVVYDISASSTTGSVSLIASEKATINDLSLSCTTGGVNLYASDANITGEISCSTTTGGVNLYATNANFTGEISCTTTTGGVLLNFTSCEFNDNIAGSTTTGGVTLNSYNAKYAQNINLNLGATTGGITMNILHYTEMGANVTGTLTTVTGGVTINYIDTVSNIGVRFTNSWVTGDETYTTGPEFISGTTTNYNTAISRYTISSSTTTGGISITASSAV